MTLIWTDPRGARLQLIGLLLAGSAAGVFAPKLAASAGPAAAPALLALALVVGGWIGRGGRLPRPARFVLALAGGALIGLLALELWAGLATALLGLMVGLALTPKLEKGLLVALAGALPAATGAVVGGVLGGALEQAPFFATWSAPSQSAALAGLLALGVGLGELSRYLVVARHEPPAWIDTLRETCSDSTRPLISAAVDGYRRVVAGTAAVRRMEATERRETLNLARELLEAAGRAVDEADSAIRATASLSQHAGDLEGHHELQQARADIRESLEEQARRSREDAAQHAARLTRMAAALAERRAPAPALEDRSLARRAEDLEQRVLTDAPSKGRLVR